MNNSKIDPSFLLVISIKKPFVPRSWLNGNRTTVRKPNKVRPLDLEFMEVVRQMLGPRFENLVAKHLLKRLQFEEDQTGTQLTLYYLRGRDDREVDFVKYSDERPKKRSHKSRGLFSEGQIMSALN